MVSATFDQILRPKSRAGQTERGGEDRLFAESVHSGQGDMYWGGREVVEARSRVLQASSGCLNDAAVG